MPYLTMLCLALPALAGPVDDLADALLRDGSYKVRVKAARSLGTQGDRRAVSPLVFALRDDHPLVRAAAAHALGQLGDAKALKALCGLRSDRDDFVRRTVDASLGGLGGIGACQRAGGVGVRIRVSAEAPAQQAAVQRRLEALTRAREGLDLLESDGAGPGIELMVRVTSDVRSGPGGTAVTCAMNQSVFDLPQRALRGTARPSAEVTLGASASPGQIAGGQEDCVEALTGAVFDALVAYAERR